MLETLQFAPRLVILFGLEKTQSDQDFANNEKWKIPSNSISFSLHKTMKRLNQGKIRIRRLRATNKVGWSD